MGEGNSKFKKTATPKGGEIKGGGKILLLQQFHYSVVLLLSGNSNRINPD